MRLNALANRRLTSVPRDQIGSQMLRSASHQIRTHLLDIGLACALVAVVVVSVLSTGSTPQAAASIRTQAAEMGVVQTSVSSTGNLQSVTSLSLGFPIAGTVNAIDVSVGQQVTSGQSLASIDPTAAQSALSSAQDNLSAAQAKLASDQQVLTPQGLEADQIALEQAQQSLANAQQNAALDATSQNLTLSQDQQNLATDQSQLASDQQELKNFTANYNNDVARVNTDKQQVSAIESQQYSDTLKEDNDQNQETTDSSTLAADQSQLTSDEATLASEQKADTNCTGSNTIYSAQCVADMTVYQAAVNTDEANVASAKTAVANDQALVSQDQKSLATDSYNLSSANSTLSSDQSTESSDNSNLTSYQNKVLSDQTAVTNAQNTLDSAQLNQQSSATKDQQSIQSAQMSLQSTQVSNSEKETPSASTLASDQSTVTQDEQTVSQDQQNLQDTLLVAPSQGTIASINGVVGQDVSASGASALTSSGASSNSGAGSSGLGAAASSSSSSSGFITLVDMSTMEVVVGVAETDAANVQVGQSAVVTLNAIPGKELSGTVTEVSPISSTVSNVVTYNVTVVLNRSIPNEKPGMTANVTIITGQQSGVITVPSSAVHTLGGTSTVTVVGAHNKETITPVVTGLVGTSQTAILNGLKVGENIVVPTISTTSILSAIVSGTGTSPTGATARGGLGGAAGGGGGGVARFFGGGGLGGG